MIRVSPRCNILERNAGKVWAEPPPGFDIV